MMNHTVLFTGHMIDAGDRKAPRFPAYKENAARLAIRSALEKEIQTYGGYIMGIAGGSSGGDILFHESCDELGIQSAVFLALPEEEYKKTSVSFAGKDWELRFDALTHSHTVQILSRNKNNDENIWEQVNQWMLKVALTLGSENMTLLALWNGNGGDAEGGTEHLVSIAAQEGAKIKIICINIL